MQKRKEAKEKKEKEQKRKDDGETEIEENQILPEGKKYERMHTSGSISPLTG